MCYCRGCGEREKHLPCQVSLACFQVDHILKDRTISGWWWSRRTSYVERGRSKKWLPARTQHAVIKDDTGGCKLKTTCCPRIVKVLFVSSLESLFIFTTGPRGWSAGPVIAACCCGCYSYAYDKYVRYDSAFCDSSTQ